MPRTRRTARATIRRAAWGHIDPDRVNADADPDPDLELEPASRWQDWRDLADAGIDPDRTDTDADAFRTWS